MRALLGIFIVTLLSCSSCKPKDKEKEKEFDLTGMLTNVGENIIVPSYQNFKSTVDILSVAADTFANNPTTPHLLSLRVAFKNAYINWQKCDVFEFGPAMDNALRANFNVYPTDTAKITTNVSSGSFNIDVLTNSDAKGFPAIDFLLYGDNQIDAHILATFTTHTNAANRKQYLLALISGIKTKTDATVSAWGSYITTFKTSLGYSVGSSAGLLVNAMNSYYERYLRDGKVGIPVGIRSLGIALPRQTEAFYGKFSTELLNASLQSFQNLYLGKYGSTNGLGLDDHLVACDGAAIDENLRNYLADAVVACNSLSDPLSQQIINNQTSVEAVYSKLQKVIIPLKVDMPSKLGILISYQDNDGD
ncbi:MAG: imelysin family protein [Flavobacteriales bacterium]